MAIRIKSIQDLQDYFQGVIARTHHAPRVKEIALALLGAVIWKSDGDIDVKQYAGRPANMMWFEVNGNKYLMKYDHANEQIELHDRNSKILLYTFDNSTTIGQVISTFEIL